MSICHSVHPAKTVARNEMPFGKDTRVVPGNTVLDRGHGPSTGRGDLGDRNPHSKFALQIAAKPLQVSGMVTIDSPSLQELSNALSNGTITDPI